MTLRGKWAIAVVIALVLSVSVNVFAAGMMAGRWAHHPPGRHFDRGFSRFMDRLPHHARGELRERFDARRPELKDRTRAVREARRRVAELIRAETVDAESLEAALAEVRERSVAAQALVHEIVAEAVLELPPEVRAEWEPYWRFSRRP